MESESQIKNILYQALRIPVPEFSDAALIDRHEWVDVDHPDIDRVVTQFPVEPDIDAILNLSDSEPMWKR